MEFVFLTYLATVCESLKSFLGTLDSWIWIIFVTSTVVWAVTTVIYSFMASADDLGLYSKNEEFNPTYLEKADMYSLAKKLKRVFYLAVVLAVSSSLLYGLVPYKKDVFVMMGGYVVLKASEAKATNSLVDKSMAAMERWLSKQIADASKN